MRDLDVIRVGDQVRLASVPPEVEAVPDEKDEMRTKDVFRQCVGHVFLVRGISTNNRHKDTGHVELWVSCGADCDNEAKAATIWVEPDYLEIVTDTHEPPLNTS
jgi:hypothetical protein